MRKSKKTINEREFEYQDVIHNHVTTQFGYWDRIKILFGAKVRSHTEIYTGHEECIVMGSDTKTSVDRLIVLNKRGGGHTLTDQSNLPLDTR